LFHGDYEILRDVVSDISEQHLAVHIGLSQDLVTCHSLRVKGNLNHRETHCYINQAIKTADYYYKYHIQNQKISIAAVKKNLLLKIMELFRRKKLRIQGVEAAMDIPNAHALALRAVT